jgi:hypothetical protein
MELKIHLDEAMLRKRIQELQHYRRMGLTTAADIDRYESDSIKRVSINSLLRDLVYLTMPTMNRPMLKPICHAITTLLTD